jgi:hypothetical protein
MKLADRAIPTLVLCSITAILLLHTGCAGFVSKSGPDTTVVPSVPSGLVAAAGNSQVTLNWAASADATGYYVQRSTTAGGAYTQIST